MSAGQNQAGAISSVCTGSPSKAETRNTAGKEWRRVCACKGWHEPRQWWRSYHTVPAHTATLLPLSPARQLTMHLPRLWPVVEQKVQQAHMRHGRRLDAGFLLQLPRRRRRNRLPRLHLALLAHTRGRGAERHVSMGGWQLGRERPCALLLCPIPPNLPRSHSSSLRRTLAASCPAAACRRCAE